MSSVGVTFANRVLGLRLAPALQIDKAKVVPVFYSHSCQNAYSRQHPFAELCAIASMETVRMLFFMTRRLKVGGKTLRGKISIIMSNVPTIGRHEQRRYKL